MLAFASRRHHKWLREPANGENVNLVHNKSGALVGPASCFQSSGGSVGSVFSLLSDLLILIEPNKLARAEKTA